MANIGSGKITGTGDYVNLETELGLSLTADSIYSVQIQGKALFCESDTKPTSGGVYWRTFKPFGYKKESAYLWVKINEGETVSINIAE